MGYEEHSERRVRIGFRYRDKRPLPVLLAEFFLLVVLAIYFAKITVLIGGLFIEDPSTQSYFSANYRYFILDVAMFFLTISSLLGMSSHKPAGWSKAVRASLILALLTLIGLVYRRHRVVSEYVVVDPIVILPLVAVVVLLLFTATVRRYYIPPFEDLPPVMAWVRWVFFIPMFKGGDYHIVYPEDEEAVLDDTMGGDEGRTNLSGYTFRGIIGTAKGIVQRKIRKGDDTGDE